MFIPYLPREVEDISKSLIIIRMKAQLLNFHLHRAHHLIQYFTKKHKSYSQLKGITCI